GEFPSAPGLRPHAAALPRQRGSEAHGARGAEPLVVAGAHDVRPAGRRLDPFHGLTALEDQTLLERRAAPEIRRFHRTAGEILRARRARSRTALGRAEAASRVR